jgi:sec-independent protein translocase protein TatA
MRIGTTELMVILVVVLIIFGPKQLPKLAKMFGKTAKSFKDGMDDEDADTTEEEAKPVKTEKAETKTEDKAE